MPLYTDSCEHQVVGSTLNCIFSNNSLLILPLQAEMTSQYKNYFPRVKYKAIFPCSKFPHENASRFKLPFNLSLLPQLVVAHMAASSILRGHLPDSSFSGKIGAVLPGSQFVKPDPVLHISDNNSILFENSLPLNTPELI